MLNFGQNAIFSAALSGIMILAAQEILQGKQSLSYRVCFLFFPATR